MGYTHYWKRVERFDKRYERVAADFKAVMRHLSFVPLAGGSGEGQPVITDRDICFNGISQCGHAERHLGITWPDEKKGSGKSDISGSWWAGLTLRRRACGGDCSHETFSLPRVMQGKWRHEIGKIGHYDEYGEPVYSPFKEVGLYFEFCKTAYKPYDLAVIICLIIARHHLKEQILVSSDGTLEQWEDGINICRKILGYGMDFELEG